MGLKIASVPDGPAPRPQRLSLCMIMRDEEEHLARCLRSVQGVADEVVIVDTGSTDRSVRIAESFGARVLHEAWRGDFAAPRNTSIDAATGDWILVLDADEELVDGAALLPLLEDEGLEGYCLREVNFIGEEVGVEAVVNSAFRLFRNRPEYRYDGALHEQIMGRVDPQGGVTTRFCGVEIHHYGYLEPTQRAKEKASRNMEIVLREVEAKPRDSFTLFNAGVEYQRIAEDEKALELFRRSFTHLPSLRAYYASLLLRNIVASLNNLGRHDEALAVLEDALQAYPDFTDMHYLQGQAYIGRREYRAAIRSFRRAIDLGDHGGDRYLAQAGMGSFYCWHALGGLYVLIGDNHEAVRAFRRAITTAPGYYPAPLVRLARILIANDPPDAVEEYLLGLVPERRRASSLRALAEVFMAAGHVERALGLLERARGEDPDDLAVSLTAADCHLRRGDEAAALAELEAIGPASSLWHLACGKRFLAHLAAGETEEAARAIEDLGELADGLYAGAYGLALAAQTPGGPVPALPAGVERAAVLQVLFEMAGALLDIGRLEVFNTFLPLLYAVAERPADVDEPLGLLLFRHDFPDPAADRLMAAVRAEAASPEALGALGDICAHKGLEEEAEAFLRAALAADRQNLSRYIALAGLLAGAGRHADAAAALRDGLAVYPHSSVLRELRHSFTLLARATG
jgi:tetratricopeptide (TPR) repeat protein